MYKLLIQQLLWGLEAGVTILHKKYDRRGLF